MDKSKKMKMIKEDENQKVEAIKDLTLDLEKNQTRTSFYDPEV